MDEQTYVLTQEASKFYQNLQDKAKSAAAAAQSSQTPITPAPGSDPADYALTLMEGLKMDYPDSYARMSVLDKLEGWASKELQTIDITGMLTPTLNPRMTQLRNTETKFKNLLDSQSDEAPRVMDWLYRTREERIGNQYAPKFNPDFENPAEDANIYNTHFNALMFVGQTIKNGIVASDMLQSQSGISLMAKETDAALVRIAKSENKYQLKGVLQTSFAPNNVTEMEGFETGSNVGVIDTMGADLNHDWITMGQAQIAALWGQDVQLCLLVGARQIEILDALESNYYPGQTSTDMRLLNEELRSRLTNFKATADLVYRPKRGGPPIPVIREPELITNTALLFILAHPLAAEFMLGGQKGPHAMVRFTERLLDVKVVFKGFTGDFPQKAGRVRYNNVPTN